MAAARAVATRRLALALPLMAAYMIAEVVGGLAVNLVGLWLLKPGRTESLNVRGAWLHVLGDALGSIGAIVSGALIWAFGWNWADPAASVAIGVLIVYSAWALLRESVAVLMESAPGHVDVDAVRETLAAVPGVLEVHDLHVWTITSGLESLSCHLRTNGTRRECALLGDAREAVARRFGIEHVTIQIDAVDCGVTAGHR